MEVLLLARCSLRRLVAFGSEVARMVRRSSRESSQLGLPMAALIAAPPLSSLLPAPRTPGLSASVPLPPEHKYRSHSYGGRDLAFPFHLARR